MVKLLLEYEIVSSFLEIFDNEITTLYRGVFPQIQQLPRQG